MFGPVTPFAIVLFGSAAVSTVTAFFTWRWRSVPGGMSLTLLLLAVAQWTLAYALETIAVGIPAKVLWSKVSYVGITTAPLFFLTFALAYAQEEKWMTRRNLALLSLVPVASLLLAATNERHNLIWTSFTFSSHDPDLLVYGHGPWFWIMVAYVYLLLCTASLLLIRTALRQRHLYRHQAALLLLGVPLPWISNILYLSAWGPFPGRDLTPAALGLTGVLLALNMVQFRFLDLVPVARDVLVESMNDGVLVLDARNRIVDVNPAVQRLAGVDAACVGQDVATALGTWSRLVEACLAPAETRSEVCVGDSPPRCLGIQVSDLYDRRGRLSGRLVVMRDITARKLAEADQEQLVLELQEALVNVKTLRGLLPICANCKKVRDDEGYWHGVEEYVMEHSEAQFSHGICPDCTKKLYPWFEQDESQAPGNPVGDHG